MKAEVFVTCDFAQEANGKLSMMGAFDTLWVKAFPVHHPVMCVASRVRFLLHELGQHAMRIEFRDQDGKFVIPPFESILSLDNLADDSGVTGAVLQLAGIGFQAPGKYSFRLLVDGEEIASAPLYVKLAK